MPKIKDMATIRRAEKPDRHDVRIPTTESDRADMAGKPAPKPPRRLSGLTIADISRAVWFRAHQYCVKHNMPTEEHDGVVFLVADRPLAFFIKAEVPQLDEYEGGRQHIYDLLRQTTNAVNKGTVTFPKWLIRDDWHEGAAIMLFRKRGGNDRIDEVAAKLSPAEAGELRPPAPVFVSSIPQAPIEATPQEEEPVTIDPEPPVSTFAAYDPLTCSICGRKFATQRQCSGHKSSHTRRKPYKRIKKTTDNPLVFKGTGRLYEDEHYTVLPNGRLKCTKCGFETDTVRSLSPHYKTHTYEARTQQLVQMQNEITRLRAERSSKVAQVNMDAERALQVITELVANAANPQLVEENAALKESYTTLQGLYNVLSQEAKDLRATVNELGNRGLSNSDLPVVLDLLSEVIGKVQAGTYPIMRAIADIDDIVNATKGRGK